MRARKHSQWIGLKSALSSMWGLEIALGRKEIGLENALSNGRGLEIALKKIDRAKKCIV